MSYKGKIVEVEALEFQTCHLCGQDFLFEYEHEIDEHTGAKIKVGKRYKFAEKKTPGCIVVRGNYDEVIQKLTRRPTPIVRIINTTTVKKEKTPPSDK